MSTFKIVNITDTLGKRDPNYNSTLKIDYNDGMNRKTILLDPNKTTYLTIPSMPLSIHKMRMKKWIIVDEINKKELKKQMDSQKQTPTPPPNKKVTTTTTTKKKTYRRKSSSSKSKTSKYSSTQTKEKE